MDKDIYLERFNQRFQHKLSSTRNTQSLSPTSSDLIEEHDIKEFFVGIEKAVQPKLQPKDTKNLSSSDSESEENDQEKEEEPAPKEKKEEENKPKAKPNFFEELKQISENARKGLKKIFLFLNSSL